MKTILDFLWDLSNGKPELYMAPAMILGMISIVLFCIWQFGL